MSEQGPEPAVPDNTPLVAVLMEIERHIATQGWEQPPRLFALVSSAELRSAEPDLAKQLGLDGEARAEDALTAIEQDDFTADLSVTEELTQIAWPPTVAGCALSMVRTFLPSTAEGEIPDDPDDPEAALRFVENHPEREDIRVVVGVDRAGRRHGIARLASQPDELLAAEELIPGLASLLTHTLT